MFCVKPVTYFNVDYIPIVVYLSESIYPLTFRPREDMLCDCADVL